LTLKEQSFRLSDVVKMLKTVGLDSADENKINESLERLVIGYFLEKVAHSNPNNYRRNP
jgi:hypothetical protein